MSISCSVKSAYQFYNAMRMNCHNWSEPFQKILSYKHSIPKPHVDTATTHKTHIHRKKINNNQAKQLYL